MYCGINNKNSSSNDNGQRLCWLLGAGLATASDYNLIIIVIIVLIIINRSMA